MVTFLLLAKECGANVLDDALHGALNHFFRFAARGNNPYGDKRPEQGFVDNGKNGNLAFAMAAAASLTPNGEESLYAGARDAAAMTGFYTTTFMLHGHTGGGIGEIWRRAGMGLLYQKMSAQFREFMDNRKWPYDLSRHFDGSFGILGGASYDTVEWGAGDGYRPYLNGKSLVEVKEGMSRGGGGTLRGAFITKDFLDEFTKGPVTLAATTFLRYGDRAIVTMPPVPQGSFSLWIEEMKLPPIDDETRRKSAADMQRTRELSK